MKIISYLVVAAALLTTGCKQTVQEQHDDNQQFVTRAADVVVIDGCQYLYIDRGGGNCRVIALAHKGNCTNHIHIYNH